MLTLDVRLLDGRYEAATADKEVAEWPPHPARAFCALVAGARDDADWAALRWLEQQASPHVLAAGQTTELRRSGYVVTNRRETAGGSQFHPGRSNQLRVRLGSQPRADRIRFEWSAAVPATGVFSTLDRLALRMPYLGRSAGHVISQFITTPATSDDLTRFVPCSLRDSVSVMRVPFDGYLDQLREAYEQDRPATDLARYVGYAPVDAEPSGSTAFESPYSDLVVLTFADIKPDGRYAPRLTAALRAALLARVPDPVPNALHGHDLPNQAHVAFLPLADVGHGNARGRLLGLGVALPKLHPDERRTIVRAIVAPDVADHSWTLNVPGLGAVNVRYLDQAAGPQALTQGRWLGVSRQWVSVTPIAYDRYPKSMQAWTAEIARSCVVAGYPEPEHVQISTEALTPGGIRLHKSDLPNRLSPKLLRHVRLRFASPIRGPVLIGAGRYLGVGLFAPERNQ